MDEPSNEADDSGDPDSVPNRRRSEADLRDDRADAREAGLDAREDRADARDAVQSARLEHIRSILTGAGVRDDKADDRDSAADSRDASASLQSFLHDEEIAGGLKARRAAALDRMDSKTDRTSAASDRIELTGDAERADPEPG